MDHAPGPIIAKVPPMTARTVDSQALPPTPQAIHVSTTAIIMPAAMGIHNPISDQETQDSPGKLRREQANSGLLHQQNGRLVEQHDSDCDALKKQAQPRPAVCESREKSLHKYPRTESTAIAAWGERLKVAGTIILSDD